MRSALPLLVCVLAFQAGCESSSPKQPDVVTMAGGRVDGVVSAPLPKTAAAARAALIELKLQVVQYIVEKEHARVVGYTPQKERVEIDVQPHGKGSHIVLETAGRSGERISALIMSKIREKL